MCIPREVDLLARDCIACDKHTHALTHTHMNTHTHLHDNLRKYLPVNGQVGQLSDAGNQTSNIENKAIDCALLLLILPHKGCDVFD